ncbi:GNAT family N-acetyltransferase [Streptomyces bambusae]|uniref:GNAT family N-acetyltransferase n=1 Tax=Streptomyces bambusae TaxID=1550616 RepID=UPI001CFCD295|nr:GNAT family N-acetyltransferase [Streptomyces bambusae]MCB5168420.1 GNAT family N-acetyltransferase [Streptomyces bambusae]
MPMDGDEASRVACDRPGPQDRWAAGFPREDDSAPAGDRLTAAAAAPAPFGVYRIVPRSHGLTVGTIGFHRPPDASGRVTIGYGMVRAEWGRGYGAQAVAGLVEICRAHGGVTAIDAETDLDNTGSRRVLEKNGFARVRTTGDSCFYVLELAPPQLATEG